MSKRGLPVKKKLTVKERAERYAERQLPSEDYPDYTLLSAWSSDNARLGMAQDYTAGFRAGLRQARKESGGVSDLMTLHEVVKKLVGPVQPVGETYEDARRLKNIKAMTELVDRLLFDIGAAAEAESRQEASMKAIGKHAANFMADVRDAAQ